MVWRQTRCTSPACGGERPLRSDRIEDAIRVGALSSRYDFCGDRPPPQPSPASAGRGSAVHSRLLYAASNAGTGNAVTDLIFSIANREVTFFSATAPISFL